MVNAFEHPPRHDCARGACDECDLGDSCPDFIAPAQDHIAEVGKMVKLVVYIAGPISDPVFVVALQNLARFFHAEATLIRHGFAPINPASDLIAAIVAGDFAYEDFLGKDEPLVRRSDAIFMLPDWGCSHGATQELGWAFESDVPAFESVADLIAYRENLPVVSSS